MPRTITRAQDPLHKVLAALSRTVDMFPIWAPDDHDAELACNERLQRVLDEQAPEPSPAEIAEYYQRHLADFVKPEMFRLSHVFLAAASSDR